MQIVLRTEQLIKTIKLMKGKALRKHSLHEKTAASVLLKLFISSNVVNRSIETNTSTTEAHIDRPCLNQKD